MNSNFYYEYLHYHLTSHTNKKLSKNKIKNTINHTDVVPITFGVLQKIESKTKWCTLLKYIR